MRRSRGPVVATPEETPLYLFRSSRARTGGEPSETDLLGLEEGASPPAAEETAGLEPAIRPISLAEWALGGLLIRLGNRGRALRPEAPDVAPEDAPR